MCHLNITRKIRIFLVILFATTLSDSVSSNEKLPSSERSSNAIEKVKYNLEKMLSAAGLSYGAPVFIRIFKQTSELEIWLENSSGTFTYFKTYDICHFSGKLGPKVKEGDRQSPEGFYFVKSGQLNPWSNFHLSFNLGYPNAYDRYHRRTGSALMVHGNCVSVGCYAMTDSKIEEIYAVVHEALAQGQPFFRVHIFPFRMTDENLNRYKKNPWYSFWRNLQKGYRYFEVYKRPPNVGVVDGVYIFEHE